MDLDESKLANLLVESEGFPKDVCERIFKKLDLYLPILDKNVKEFNLHNKNFVEELGKPNNEDNIADKISQKLSENVSSKPYQSSVT